MSNYDFDYLRLKVPSPEETLATSYGEITKPETINYRTQRPEKDGLFSERIFGPTKDYKCYCGKFKGIRYKGTICDKCGVEVTRAIVRRERMGHIKLAAPVAHIWFLKTGNSKLGIFFDTPAHKLEKVVYYAAYIITTLNDDKKKEALESLASEYKSKKHDFKNEDKQLKAIEEAHQKAKDFVSSLKVGSVISEAEYFEFSRKFGDVFEAGTGAESLRKILEKIQIKKEITETEKALDNITKKHDTTYEKKLLHKLRVLFAFQKNGLRPEWMIMTILPVIPPDLRPMVALDGGRYASSDLNDLYRRVINRNNRLQKLIELRAPEIIITNEKRMLQEAVDALIDNTARLGRQQVSSQNRPLKSLADILKGKQGRFRQNLLGKRVDYSGRSVIVVGPDLKLNECGIPKKMALELFKPFVIKEILERGMAHNIKNASRLIEQGIPEVWEILEEVIANKAVLLNRAPTLHRLSIQAFKPVLIEDLAIRIPPMVCSAFNADFDGDQMAVHLPLSKEAQDEAWNRMLSSKNIIKPANGDPIATPSQDMVLGCYYLTKTIETKDEKDIKSFSSINEVLMSYEFGFIKINEAIRVGSGKSEVTSVGRLIFNSILPPEFGYVNAVMDKKALSNLIARYIDQFGSEAAWEFLDKVKTLGFKAAATSGMTWSIFDLHVPEEKKALVTKAYKEIEEITKQYENGFLDSEEKKSRSIRVWNKVKEEVSKLVPKALAVPGNPIFDIIDSKARGSWEQAVQTTGMKGLVSNPQGEVIELPVISSYKDGLSVLEFFINSHGARKGLTDTALKTAQAGYLTRRLVDVAQDLIVNVDDCKTKEGIIIERSVGDAYGYNLSHRVFGRILSADVKEGNKIIARSGEVVDRELAEKISKSSVQTVSVRSPITCKALYGLCAKCYGMDLGKLDGIKQGEAVGIVAAQSIGEPGTQLTLRTFHVGGVAQQDITSGLPRIEEVFEARPPKGRAALAHEDGIIQDIEEKGPFRVLRIKPLKRAAEKTKVKIEEYSAPRNVALFVGAGDKVKKGQQLFEGSVDIKELFLLKGAEEAQKYIINEVQKIYVSNGNVINDKHVEIIVRQMFARVSIKEPGDSTLVPGQVLEKSRFLEINRRLKSRGKIPAKAKQLLMGITRVSLSTESFLSAASFQETARVLVNAATECKIDKLRGLKENVIIGRLIPAGTGYRPKNIPATDNASQESDE
ncbi:MAG TPA: DNA-directed RNA polymerase subunit beta' [Candidatus Paceibacterota bacterium]|nr:DNA-directed RNA polymerase subunit beta' [Candidatus Paceibacterota bacterium]